MNISSFSESRYQYKAPCINPINNDEIVLNYYDNQINEFKLIKVNFVSNTKTELINDVRIVTRLKWSNSGVIAFDNHLNADYQMRIINDDGSNLIQVTITVHNIYPVWNSLGTELFYQHSPNLGIPYFFRRYKMSNSATDTVLYDTGPNAGFVGMSDVNSDNQIIGITGIDNKVYLAISDISNINFDGVLEMSPTFGSFYPTGLCWSNDNVHAYITIPDKGLFKLNTSTKEIELLLSFCDSKKYKNISCSSDGSFLIAERVNSELIKNNNNTPTGEIRQSSLIYRIDIPSMKETKIEIQ